MLLTITHLKAPWPAGAVVGDVIDLPGVPHWALGKCIPAPNAAQVTIRLNPAEQAEMAGVKAVANDGDAPARQDSDRPRRGRPRKDAA
jgi:hypothetical protein